MADYGIEWLAIWSRIKVGEESEINFHFLCFAWLKMFHNEAVLSLRILMWSLLVSIHNAKKQFKNDVLNQTAIMELISIK